MSNAYSIYQLFIAGIRNKDIPYGTKGRSGLLVDIVITDMFFSITCILDFKVFEH